MILCRMSLVFKILDSYFYFDDTKILQFVTFRPSFRYVLPTKKLRIEVRFVTFC